MINSSANVLYKMIKRKTLSDEKYLAVRKCLAIIFKLLNKKIKRYY
jgi:hypothetical protein